MPNHIMKVVDVTKECPQREERKDRIFLIFTKSKHRWVVKIKRAKRFNKGCSVEVSFLVDSLSESGWMNIAPRDDVFGSFATELGLSKSDLCKLIKNTAP